MATIGTTKAHHVERLAGNLLRLARAEAEMSQRELAAAAHVAETVIAGIESGALQPSLPELARLLAAVDLEMRTRLAPYDNHDDVLDATASRLTPDQHARRRDKLDAFSEALRTGLDAAD
ncbi:transcriptional regulator with XRE-family HTH domain [Mycolicibacterium iranicum]|uniref:Transcriptional regulator with XRE-family HTH domain n=1 Tax=Mycolicibacterium iranicum TaxID=912594 RepID=A0A839Q6H6_MYCIR|nr:helix-turn-helix transcriptional regulator [Mycolicibacterium iranicum]MBB2991093.1 transcriptional regulator with XRE-family HTH domain [Mycolicibacterium iranicum]